MSEHDSDFRQPPPSLPGWCGGKPCPLAPRKAYSSVHEPYAQDAASAPRPFSKNPRLSTHLEAAYCLLKLSALGSLAGASTSCPGPRGPKGQAKRFAMSRAEVGRCVGARPAAPHGNALLPEHRRMM